MKKIIALMASFAFFIGPTSSILASTESVPFFEALGNFSKIEDYKSFQSFYGKAELEEFSDHLSVAYRFSMNSAVDASKTSSFSRINAYIKFFNHNEVSDFTPFKEMILRASGELIADGQTDWYFRLNNLSVNLEQGLPFAQTDIEELTAIANLYKGNWYHSSVNDLGGEFDSEIEVAPYVEYQELFKEDPKAALLGLSEQVLLDSDEGFSDNNMEEIMEGISLALETRLFTEREVVSGRNEGFQFFNLNKASIINFFKKLGNLLGEELTDADVSEIRAALSKVSLSGIYRVEKEYGTIDNLLLRLKLKDIEVLKNLEMNYRFKASDINKSNVIEVPSEHEEWSEVAGSL